MARKKLDRKLMGSSPWKVRRAGPRDFPAVVALEASAFQPYRRASPASLRRSLSSGHQSVWVIEAPRANPAALPDAPGSTTALALLVLWHFPHRFRVYDVAAHPALQGHGLGTILMRHGEALAGRSGAEWMSLEADPEEPHLVDWYRHQGYVIVARLPHYYRNGNAAVRMVKRLTAHAAGGPR